MDLENLYKETCKQLIICLIGKIEKGEDLIIAWPKMALIIKLSEEEEVSVYQYNYSERIMQSIKIKDDEKNWVRSISYFISFLGSKHALYQLSDADAIIKTCIYGKDDVFKRLLRISTNGGE